MGQSKCLSRPSSQKPTASGPRVWQGEGFSVNPNPDDHADHARHWIVTRDEKLVGTARMCIHNTAEETPAYEDIGT